MTSNRVHSTAFRVLSLARPVLRATNPDHKLARLPYEVLERIVFCAGKGALNHGQINRLLDHAADGEWTLGVAKLFKAAAHMGGETRCKQLRNGWLHNGGFWCDVGYDAGRGYIVSLDKPGSNPHAQWPDHKVLDAVVRFLAFTPLKNAHWPYNKRGDEMKVIVDKYDGVE